MTEQDQIKSRVDALLLLVEKAEALINDAMLNKGAGHAAVMELSRAVLCARAAFHLQFPQHQAVCVLPDGSRWRPNNAKLS